MTTVGYGDKSPRTATGQGVALLAMLLSLFLVGAFVSQVTGALQAEVGPPVDSLADVDGRPVGVVEGTSFAEFVEGVGVTPVPFSTQEAVFEAAERGEVDLMIANPYALAIVGPRYGVSPAGATLYDEFETFGLAQGSPWREPINEVLADLLASGEIEAIVERWTP